MMGVFLSVDLREESFRTASRQVLR